MIPTIIALGLVNWLTTTIIVESELTRPLREWFKRKGTWQQTDEEWDAQYAAHLRGEEPPKPQLRLRAWRKAAYLVACHLCTGTWIGLVLAALGLVHPFGPGVLGWTLTGLLIKAIGHLTLVVHKAGERLAK